MEPTEPTTKQQTIELLRSSQTLLVTTGKNPGIDTIAATVGLTQMLDKLGKRVEAVVSAPLPKSVHFLPVDMIHDRFNGMRDFVIELDTSKVEADKLKYIPETGRLKVFITPFNGSFTKDDVNFSYGDYHCDAVLVLGASGQDDIDPAISDQKELVTKTKLIFINAGTPAATSGTNMIAWGEPQATGLSEIMMSLSEALASGLMDAPIATSLLTGIIASTNHFTGPNTTPKVMTMAAQLLAAGGDQATIVRELGSSLNPNAVQTAPTTPPPASDKGDHELSPSTEQALPHKPGKPGRPSSRRHRAKQPQPQPTPAPAQPAPNPAPVVPPPPPPPPTRSFVPPPAAQAQPTPPQPAPVTPPPPPITPPPPPEVLPPVHMEMKPVGQPITSPSPPPPPPLPPQPAPPPMISDIRAPVDTGVPPSTSPFDSGPIPPTTPTSPVGEPPMPILDVEAARQAVEEATRDQPPTA